MLYKMNTTKHLELDLKYLDYLMDSVFFYRILNYILLFFILTFMGFVYFFKFKNNHPTI